MKIETLGEMIRKLPSGHTVMYTLFRINGELAENRVVIISGNIATTILVPVKPTDLPELRISYPEANI